MDAAHVESSAVSGGSVLAGRPTASPTSVPPPAAGRRAPARPTLAAVLAWAPALLLLGGFGWWFSGGQPLWEDDTYGLLLAQQPLSAIVQTFTTTEAHLPPYFLVLRAWELLAGPTAFAERWPSVACALLTGLLIWRTARLLAGDAAGWLAFGLWAIQPQAFWYEQAVRMYAPLMLFTALTIYRMHRAIRTDRPSAWLLVSLAELAALWTHYAGLLAAAAAGLLGLVGAPPAARKRAVLATALPVATLLPWLWAARHLTPNTIHPSANVWQQGFQVGRELLFGFGAPMLPAAVTAIGASAAALAIIAALLLGARPVRLAALIAATPLLVPLLLPPLYFLFNDRYLTESLPLLCTLGGTALIALGRRSLPVALAVGGGLALASLAGLGLVLAPGFHVWYDYPAATAYVRGHEQPGEAFITNSAVDPTARYYYQRVEQGTLPVILLPAAHHDSVAATAQAAQGLGQRYDGLWLVQDASGTWDGDQVAPRALALDFPQTALVRTRDVTVRHYLTPRGLAARRAAPAGAVFGGTIRLTSFGVQTLGRELLVSMQWQALAPVRKEYTVFVHLLGRDGRLAAQHDGSPDDGRQPTSGWAAGTSVADLHPIAWAGDPAVATLEIGWYDPKTGQRLALPGSASNSLVLGSLAALLPTPTPAEPAGAPR